MIEMAFCAPVLVILLFYIIDLAKIQQFYLRTELAGLATVNMIQNKQSNKGVLTIEELYAIHLHAWKTIYPTSNFCKTSGILQSKQYPVTILYYVQGKPNGKASCLWRVKLSYYDKSTSTPANIKYDIKKYSDTSPDIPLSRVRFLQDTTPSNIYPLLVISDTDYPKIIVETFIEHDSSLPYKTVNNKNYYSTPKESVGLLLSNPPRLQKNSTLSSMFHSVVIFTPTKNRFNYNYATNNAADATPPSASNPLSYTSLTTYSRNN